MPRSLVPRIALSALLAAAVSFASIAWGAPPAMKAGEVILKFKQNASSSDINSVRAGLGATKIKHFGRIRADHERISGLSVDQAISRYRGHRAVEFIEPNYIYEASRVPNDPDFGLLWGLRNTGQVPGGVPGADIKAVSAWDLTTGSDSVVVAIIDTGIDYTHPDLEANIYSNPGEIPGNGLDDDENGFPDDVRGWDFVNADNDPIDDHGHGTHCAGTVGAVGDNEVGVVGVNWNVSLMPIKFLNSGGFGTTAGAIACVEYATLMGVEIISASWGGGGFSEALRQAIQDADEAGIVFVAAAGNAGEDNDVFPNYPSGYDVPNIISVASTTAADVLSGFSNFGDVTVDLAAPGSGILSTTPGNTYSVFSGTSMATPHVAGALALMMARFPGIPHSSAKTVLLNSVDRLPSLEGRVVTGGRLNAFRALGGVDSIPPDPVLDLAALGSGSNSITLDWTATGDDGGAGTATEYEIRYAPFAIDEANFHTATRLSGAPIPSVAGSHEHVVVNGLSFATTYHVAMRVKDEFGNSSSISNVASATTFVAPDIEFSPSSFSEALLTGAVVTRTLTLRNVTPGTLDFNVVTSLSPPAPPDPGGPPPDSTAVAPGILPWIEYARAGAADSTRTVASPAVTTTATLPVVITDPPDAAIDLITLRALSEGGTLHVEMEFRADISPFNFGGFLSVDTDQNRLTGHPPVFGNGFQDIGAEYDFDFFSLPFGFVGIRDATGIIVASVPVEVHPRLIRFSTPLTLLGNDDGFMDVTGVIGDSFGPTDWFPDAGHGTITGLRWLTVEPENGTVGPGGTVDVTVRFDAAGLVGGPYDGRIRVFSNDPDEPEVEVSAHLDVTGVQDIELSKSSFNYGSLFVGASGLDSLVVSNPGTDLLDVTEISSSHGDFAVSVGSLSLSPGEERAVFVTFTPTSVGPIAGTLRVRSNDPDEPELLVPLSGEGLVPPEISVTPTSLSAALLTGATETRTVTISNIGGSPLTLTMNSRRANPPAGLGPGAPAAASGSASSQTREDTPVAPRAADVDSSAAVLVIQNTSAWGLEMAAFLFDRFGITATVINSGQIAATDFNAYDLVITVGDEGAAYYNEISSHAAKFEAYAAAGGTIQYQLATQGDDVTLAGGVHLEYGELEFQNRVLLPGHPIVAGLPLLLDGNFANHGFLTGLPAGATVITETANSHRPTTVEYSIGAGNIIATGMTWEYLYPRGYNAGQMLYLATLYNLSNAHPRWLRVSPNTATVPPGGTLEVAVTFDATGLLGGGYDGLIQVLSNDPDESEIEIPAHLDVTGVQDIALSKTSLDYGSLFVGASRQDSLVVSNPGTDLLDVTEISSSHGDFAVSVGSFSLNPGEARVVYVTFIPTSVGPISGTLRVRSNDPDEAELLVPLSGEGLVPPEISVTPTSLSASLLTGQTATRTLTISNTGGNDLTFDLSVVAAEVGAGGTVSGSGGRTFPDRPGPGVATTDAQSPTLNTTAPSSGPITVLGSYSGTHLRFGITDLGEMMPFQYPLGNEHLQVGAPVAGYTVAYIQGGVDHVHFAAVAARTGIVFVSYQELVNTPTKVVVEVVTRTFDNVLRIRRLFTFPRNAKFVRVESFLTNTSGHPVTDVVFKEHADWDLDADYEDDDWDYDPERNMAYAFDVKFAAIGAGRTPDVMDIYGWNDYFNRNTSVDFPTGPVINLDGMEVLHFEMGDLAPAGSTRIVTAYGAADNLTELRNVMRLGTQLDWLTLDPQEGTVPPGSSVDVTVTFKAAGLFGGDYASTIVVASNDPTDLEIDVPATLHVTGVPVIQVNPTTLDFGSVFLGQSASRDVTIANDGTDRLIVTGITSNLDAYVADASAFELEPGGSRLVHVTFAPTVSGSQPATLTIVHNAEGTPTPVSLAGVGLVPPVISVAPASIRSDLPTDGQETHTLQVNNGGGSNLDFTIRALTGASSVPVHAAVTSHAKGEPDTRGGPAATGEGGPDLFGYRWADSDQPGGPTFGWVEISEFGSPIPISGDDQTSLPIPIGFPFPFYGNTFTSLQVCTNGFLSFTSSSAQFVNQPLPTPFAPENLVSAFWDDLLVGPSSRVYVHSDGSRMVVEWQNVFLLGGGGPFTFEIILFRTGTILCQYLSMTGSTASSTVGIQNQTQDDGLTIAFNAPYLHNNLAIRIAASPSWLTLDTESGTVPAGGTAPVHAMIDATGIFPGDYDARLRFESNDPMTPSLEVPVTLHVIGVPHLEVTPLALDFGTLFLGQSATRTLTFHNTGTDILHVTSIGAGLPDYSFSTTSFNLPSLQSTEVVVTFAPVAAGNRASAITIGSDDPSSPHSVPLAGAGLVPPLVGVSPTDLVAASLPGGQTTKTLRVCNTGGSDLNFTIPTPLLTIPTVAQGSYVENAKGGVDPRPSILGIGGPDAYGHIWADSDDPGGPIFQWVDITATGTRVPFGPNEDDRTLGPFPIGFDFPYYGAGFDSFYVCTNGWLSFTNSSNTFDNQPLPNAHAGVPENLIAIFWDDLLLQTANNANIHYRYDGSKLIVQFTNMRVFNVISPVLHTFEVFLYPNGEVRYQYLTVGALLGGGTIGIQNGARDDGLTVAFNSNYLHDGLAVVFTRPPRWIEVSPTAGSIPAGGCMDLAVHFDAAELAPADYASRVPVMSNDPAHPRVVANVLYHVGSTHATYADIDPNTVNLDGNGRWVKAVVELPAGVDPSQTVLSTVRFQGQIPVDQDALVVGDSNQNGIPDLKFQFDRDAVEGILSEGDPVTVQVTGEIENTTYFIASEDIRVIRPRVTAPNGGEILFAGSLYEIRWTNPSGWHVDHADLYYSADEGVSWTLIVQGIAAQSYAWTVPSVTSSEVLIRVYLYDDQGVMGYDSSDNVFGISQVTAVAEERSLPTVHALFQNNPNPFNPITSMRFDLPVPSPVLLVVYNVEGRVVRTLLNTSMPAGRHRVLWDGRNERGQDVATGVYYYRLQAGAFSSSRRMLLLK